MDVQGEEPLEKVTVHIPVSVKAWYDEYSERVGITTEELMAGALFNQIQAVEHKQTSYPTRTPNPYYRDKPYRPVY